MSVYLVATISIIITAIIVYVSVRMYDNKTACIEIIKPTATNRYYNINPVNECINKGIRVTYADGTLPASNTVTAQQQVQSTNYDSSADINNDKYVDLFIQKSTPTNNVPNATQSATKIEKSSY